MSTTSAERTIPISRPDLSAADLDAFRELLTSGWVTMGPAVAAFEEAIGEIVGTPALATSSCTSAMHLAMLHWGIGRGDDVIVPAFTFVASAHAVAMTGATPVFCDVDEETMAIDPAAAEAAITPRTRAIMAVHYLGIPAEMDLINAIARHHGLLVLEDAACALGARYRGRPCGSLGDAGAFSFHPRKVVTTGEGGILSSADEALLSSARAQRNHGAAMSGFDRHALGVGAYPSFDVLGFNYRMTDVQARMGLVQLERLGANLAARDAQVKRYRQELSDLPGIRLPELDLHLDPSWISYALRVSEEAPVETLELQARLLDRGVRVVPLGQLVPGLGYYRERSGYRTGAFPHAERLDSQGLAIPCYPTLTVDDQAYVIDAIRAGWR